MAEAKPIQDETGGKESRESAPLKSCTFKQLLEIIKGRYEQGRSVQCKYYTYGKLQKA